MYRPQGRLFTFDRTLLITTVATGVARAVGAVLVLLLSIGISRLLGPAGAGVFFLGLVTMTTVSQVTRFGLPTYLMKYLTPLIGDNRNRRARLLLWRIMILSVLINLPVSVILAGLSHTSVLGDWLYAKEGLDATFVAFMLALTPFSLVWLVGGALKAQARPAMANLVESAFVPAGVLLVILWNGNGETITVTSAAFAYSLVTMVGAVVGVVLALHNLPRGVRSKAPRTVEGNPLKFGWTITVSSIATYLILWLPFMFLGRFGNDVDVGIFGAVQRLGFAILLVPVVIHSVFSPRFVNAYVKKDFSMLGREYRTATLISGAVAAPIAAVLCIFPELALSMFGSDFESGAGSLRWLVVLISISICLGPSDLVMMMCGKLNLLSLITVCVALLSAGVGIALTVFWGPMGSALATGMSLVILRLVGFAVLVNVGLYPRSGSVPVRL